MKYQSALLGIAVAIVVTSVAAAGDYSAGAIEVGNPWARATAARPPRSPPPI